MSDLDAGLRRERERRAQEAQLVREVVHVPWRCRFGWHRWMYMILDLPGRFDPLPPVDILDREPDCHAEVCARCRRVRLVWRRR